jgi:hypothetical protein
MKGYLWFMLGMIVLIATAFIIFSPNQSPPPLPENNFPTIVTTPTIPCIKAGEEWLNDGGNILGECCAGLKTISEAPAPASSDVKCEDLPLVNGGSICSDCGNNNCESWENVCTCPNDCMTGCHEEGKLFSTMPLPTGGQDMRPCCNGLKMLYAIDVAVCSNCGNGICDTFDANIKENTISCPEDCK